MPTARRELVCLDATPYYHVVSRCVRRAFLCGLDHLTGKSYEHRKEWIVDRLTELSDLFAIDLCAYAVMSNHCHLVVRLDPETAESWSEEEVMERWERLFSLPVLVQRYRTRKTTSPAEIETAQNKIETWRERLSDLSWFMRCLNEPIARQANAEDGCTGRFWEGRYKSQALLDEAALLTCMAYVDLNPIRAGLAETPEKSEYTAIQQRIQEVLGTDRTRKSPVRCPDCWISPAMSAGTAPMACPSAWMTTLSWWTGVGVLSGRTNAGRFRRICPRFWIGWRLMPGPGSEPYGAVKECSSITPWDGPPPSRLRPEQFGRAFFKGLGFARQLFPEPG
jgi:REP element-mobilizing transposase RayT